MKSYSSREVIDILLKNGWKYKNSHGDHHYYVHPDIKVRITIQHPMRDMKVNNIKNISRMTGIIFK